MSLKSGGQHGDYDGKESGGGADPQLTTLDGGWDFHSSPPFVTQLTGWRLVPVGREVAELIPELDDSPLGWKTSTHTSREESAP